MEVIIQRDYQQMSKVAARIVAEVLNTKPNAVLGMATGSTPWACIRSWCDCTKRSSSMAASGNRLKLFASPWSPPAFMKDNNDMLHGGHLRADVINNDMLHGGHLRADVMAVQRWESCVYQAGDERYFLKNHLGSGHGAAGASRRQHHRVGS